MKKAIFLAPLVLAGCSLPDSLPFLGSLDGKADVQIEAKIITKSGEVRPVPNVTFQFQVYDSKTNVAEVDQAQTKQIGSFITDFDGKAKIRAVNGLLLVSGSYSILEGSSKSLSRLVT